MSTGVKGRDRFTDLIGRPKRRLWEDEPLTELDPAVASLPLTESRTRSKEMEAESATVVSKKKGS